MKAYKEAEVRLFSFLTSITDKGEWSASRPTRFNLGSPRIGEGWESPGADLDVLEKRKSS